jgi:hypothetical protein
LIGTAGAARGQGKSAVRGPALSGRAAGGTMRQLIRSSFSRGSKIRAVLRNAAKRGPAERLGKGNTDMPTVQLVDETTNHPVVRRVFADIKATKKIDRVPNFWRALAVNPDHLEMTWTRLKTVMRPGKIDLLTKEIIALAVSATNSCHY